MSFKSSIEENIKHYDEYIANIQESYFNDFKLKFKELADKFPEVESFSVVIYYPQFNDGDACVPNVRRMYIEFNEETTEKFLKPLREKEFEKALKNYEYKLAEYEKQLGKRSYGYGFNKKPEEPKKEDYDVLPIDEITECKNREDFGFGIDGLFELDGRQDLESCLHFDLISKDILNEDLHNHIYYLVKYVLKLSDFWINRFGDHCTIQLTKDLKFKNLECWEDTSY